MTGNPQVMGADFKRAATATEIEKMSHLVDQEMKAGGIGLSSGLEYDPGFYSTTEELVACAKVAARHHGIYISHVRDECNKAMESFAELIEIAKEAGIPAQISHIKLASIGVWGKSKQVLDLIAQARTRHLDISADVYPYTYWQSTVVVLIPTRDWGNRAAWEKGLAEVGGPGHVLLSTFKPDPSWAGKTIEELAKITHKDAVSVIQEIVKRTQPPAPSGDDVEEVIVTAMADPDLKAFMAAPGIMFCSDGRLEGSHPRGAGTFPRILGRFVREQKLMSWEQAIHKMTQIPAARMHFEGRGVIRAGAKADVVLLDPEKVLDMATTAQPTAAPVGILHVFVNGVAVLEHGKITGKRPGRILTR